MRPPGLRILAVDDERRQLLDLTRLLRQSPAVAEVACAADGPEALQALSAASFDGVFLDVRMPGLSGLELSRVLRRFVAPPQLVFVTAHEDAAVEAFELRALDYLLKPVSRARLEEALERVGAAVRAQHPGRASAQPEVIAAANLRSGTTRLVHRQDILYAQSHGDFVRIVTAEGRYLLRSTLTELEHRWEAQGFVRVHRQYLANLGQATELRPAAGDTAELVYADGQVVPVARRHVAGLSRRLAA